jgi:hypothetical protein
MIENKPESKDQLRLENGLIHISIQIKNDSRDMIELVCPPENEHETFARSVVGPDILNKIVLFFRFSQ